MPKVKPVDAEPSRTDNVHVDATEQHKTHTVYLEHGNDLLPVQHEHPREFQIFVGGKPFYHVREAADGAWIYRGEF